MFKNYGYMELCYELWKDKFPKTMKIFKEQKDKEKSDIEIEKYKMEA